MSNTIKVKKQSVLKFSEKCGLASRTNVDPHCTPPPNTFEEEGLVGRWPITQPLFLSGPRWDWIQMGHLITSLPLSVSALGWSFLCSDLTLSMPATLHPPESK